MLKEKDLLEYLKKLGAKEIKKINSNFWDIHYKFRFSDLEFSIISYNQYCKEQKEYLKNRNMNFYLKEKKIWEIYCYDFDNDVMRSKNLMDFNEFIAECIEIKEKNND